MFLAFALLPLNNNAQDNHYTWTQFGSHNSILNNASLSRFEDESAVIINPATLSLANQSSFNFNANALGFTNSQFKNEAGEGFTIKSSDLSLLPSTISGVIKPKNQDKTWVLGYALFTSNKDRLNFSNTVEKRLNIIDDKESPGDETYKAQNNILNTTDELTFVAGIGWNLGSNISLGVSQNIIYREQDHAEILSSYALADPPAASGFDLAGGNYSYLASYYKFMTNTKFGLTTKIKDWNLGFVFTSPTIGLLGNGSIIADFSLTNIRIGSDPDTPRKNLVASGDYRKLSTRFKYPMNAAFGVSHAFGKIRLYGSLFWHNYLKTYTILDPGNAPFIQPTSEKNNSYTSQLLNAWGKSKTIYNGSIAADWAIKSDYHIFFSFRTDFHYAENDPQQGGFDLVFKQWDYYHFTIGTQRSINASDLVIGIRYSYGRESDFPQPISLNDPTQDDYFDNYASIGTLTSHGIQLMLSYTFTFGDFGLDK